MKKAQTLPNEFVQKLTSKKTVKVKFTEGKSVFDQGGRNDALFKLGCSLRRQDLPYEATRKMLHLINTKLCKPSLSKEEVNTVMKSTSRYDEASEDLFCDISGIKSEAVDWYWYPYFPRGCITFLDGHPGRGKSYFTMFFAALTSTGGKLPFSNERLEKGRVLILNAEDDPAKTMRPRLEKAGANLEPNRIHFQGRFKPLTKEGIQVLESKILSFKPDLVIIDPILTYMGSEVDSNRFNEVTEFLTYIDQLARDHNICVVGVRHMSKSNNDNVLNKGLGSIGLIARARSALHIGLSRDDDKIIGLAHVKSNWGEKGPTLLYRLVGGTKTENPKLEWVEVADYGAENLDPVPSVGRPKAEPNLSEILIELLGDGPIGIQTIINTLQSRGIDVSKSTINRELPLIADLVGKGSKSVWKLR